MSRTEEIADENGELELREFYCGECGHYELTYITEAVIDCPRCFRILEPNESFVFKIIKSRQ